MKLTDQLIFVSFYEGQNGKFAKLLGVPAILLGARSSPLKWDVYISRPKAISLKMQPLFWWTVTTLWNLTKSYIKKRMDEFDQARANIILLLKNYRANQIKPFSSYHYIFFIWTQQFAYVQFCLFYSPKTFSIYFTTTCFWKRYVNCYAKIMAVTNVQNFNVTSNTWRLYWDFNLNW